MKRLWAEEEIREAVKTISPNTIFKWDDPSGSNKPFLYCFMATDDIDGYNHFCVTNSEPSEGDTISCTALSENTITFGSAYFNPNGSVSLNRTYSISLKDTDLVVLDDGDFGLAMLGKKFGVKKQTANGNIKEASTTIGTYELKFFQSYDYDSDEAYTGSGSLTLNITTAASGTITLEESTANFTGVLIDTTSGEQALVSCVNGTLHFSSSSTGTFKGGVTLFSN